MATYELEANPSSDAVQTGIPFKCERRSGWGLGLQSPRPWTGKLWREVTYGLRGERLLRSLLQGYFLTPQSGVQHEMPTLHACLLLDHAGNVSER